MILILVTEKEATQDTPSKYNMEPENNPWKRKVHLDTHNFQVPRKFQGCYTWIIAI